MKERILKFNKIVNVLLILSGFAMLSMAFLFYFSNHRVRHNLVEYDAEIISAGIYLIVLILLKFDLKRFMLRHYEILPSTFISIYDALITLASILLFSVICLLGSLSSKSYEIASFAIFFNVILLLFFFLYILYFTIKKRVLFKKKYKQFAIPDQVNTDGPVNKD